VSVIQHWRKAVGDNRRAAEPSRGELSASAELRLVRPSAAEPGPSLGEGSAPLIRVSDLAQLGLRISVVIATLNEEENLPYVFARPSNGLHEVIIVEGHSKDATIEAPRAASGGCETASRVLSRTCR
jgi:hypothetical protein